MKVVILSAGQGRRLLPLTKDCPKCMLHVDGQSMIEWQVDELTKCGVERISVVVGYGADQVKDRLLGRYGPHRIRTIYNPHFAETDNLVSCWAARDEMTEDFLLLNGDTLFEAAVLDRLLLTKHRPITVTTDKKSSYDSDDMKVTLDGEILTRIGKDIPMDAVHGESIGMILFRGQGPNLFRLAMEKALRDPSARKNWYLSVIDEMAKVLPVWTCSIQGLQWCEVDYPADLEHAKRVVTVCMADGNMNDKVICQRA